MIKGLETIMARAKYWPRSAQEERARAVVEIDARQTVPSPHRASADELAGIDEGLAELGRTGPGG